jgi:hypothetical protein
MRMEQSVSKRRHIKFRRRKITQNKTYNNSYRNSQQDATVYQNLLFHVYMKLNMFRATQRLSSGAQNCTSSLWVCISEGCWTRPAIPTSNNLCVCKTRGCLCSFELLMMGVVLSETCWASYKHGIINVDALLHLVGYFCVNYTIMHGSTKINFNKQITRKNKAHV